MEILCLPMTSMEDTQLRYSRLIPIRKSTSLVERVELKQIKLQPALSGGL